MPALAKKIVLIIASFAAIFYFQRAYDAQKIKTPAKEVRMPSINFVKTVDLGLHSAAAAYFWNDTLTEIPFLSDAGYPKFASDFKLVNDLDPRFSFPYAFAVLVLPSSKLSDRINVAVEIGRRGVAVADSDWRMAFYLAAIYHTELKDYENAAKYFDIAGRAAGAPFYIRRFSLNYGIAPNLREKAKQIWTAIYQSANDDDAKERAKAYIARLDMFDYLEEAAKIYKERTGKFPGKLDELVSSGVIPKIPQDPFGFQFLLYPGGVVGIVKQ